MKKKLFLLATSILFLASCNSSTINVPKSPFSDSYQRIGMKSEYTYTLSPVSVDEYKNISKSLTEDLDPKDVSSFSLQEEYRDLEYAYFGKQSSSVSQCRMTSKSDNEQRYSNNVRIGSIVSKEQIQTSNSGIYKSDINTTDYKYDTGYKTTLSKEYEKATVSESNEGRSFVKEDAKKYDDEDVQKEFGLTPLESHIKTHFSEIPMKLFGDNCIYGKYDGGYLIKEATSVYKDHMTTSGRKYVSCKNYFYEGLLDNQYHITKFRFYSEQLILSEAWDGEGIPILYLEKPELIKYRETKYNINYGTLTPYTGDIPTE